VKVRPPAIHAPRILGLSAGLPLTLYGWRVRQRPAQELLAAAGIAVGVALVFGVLVANMSITGSARGLIDQLVGSARLQLAARSEQGFSEQLAERAGRLPGVEVASPVLRENATALGPRGSEQVLLIGVSPSLLRLGAQATRNLGAGELLISGGLGFPASVADTIGAQPGENMTLRVAGVLHRVRVRAALGSQTIGAVAESPVVIALLPVAQALTGKRGLVTDVLVKPRAGADRLVAGELRGLAAGRLDVTPADEELRVLDTAAKPNEQSTTLFAAIAGMVGFLLALNAILLTIPERRRFIAELRTFGYDPAQVTLIVATQAVALGLVGSAAGIALGYLLSHTLFGQVPSYLTVAFPIGAQRIVSASTVLVAVGCGVLAALLASLRPVLDLRPGRALDAVMHEQGEAGQSITRRVTVVLALAGVALVLLTTVLALAVPSLTIVGGVLLALAAVCLVPFAYAAVLAALAPLCERSRGMLSHAVVELEATATRSIALAAIAALAVYGSLAIGGARRDLTHGLERAIAQDSGTTDLWVTTGENVFNTTGFKDSGVLAAIAHAPGVARVRADQGGLLDIGDRRLLIRAHSPNAPAVLQSSQLRQGNSAHATELIRRGGWASVSEGFASERHLRVGDSFLLSTPSGALRLGVAAITTNLGWPPGAITFSTVDYLRGWQTTEPTALEVDLKPGLSLVHGRRAVQAALPTNSGLQVQTFREREAQADGDLRQGLMALGQISTLLLITGALAIAASLSAVIWQRRSRLAAMKTWGYDHLQLWRSLLLESAIVLAVGCADGAILGVFGHALADRWLALTTGFPAPFAVGGLPVLLPLALVAGIALAVVALPGLAAAQVPPSVSFQE
jgi:putative ABC transport system permease protein